MLFSTFVYSELYHKNCKAATIDVLKARLT